jgi:signal transduction histidine kinase
VTDIDLLRGYAVGGVDYVPVPVIPDLLRAKVRVFAELYRKTRQLEALNAELERRVAERTAELEQANTDLERRVEERTREREAALAQVHEMSKVESLGQLTGGVAHDFNNLLMAVLGNLELLSKYLPDDPRLRRLVDGAVQGAERGATLTKRMLAFARRQELKQEAIDIPDLVRGMTDLLQRSIGPTVAIETRFPLALPAVWADANQLEMALLNLAVNARDAMPEGGLIIISAHEEGNDDTAAVSGFVRICVRDTGVGMDETTLNRATEPFFTTKEPGKGTGLGLSMVHGLAQQSGGRFVLKSKPGEGSVAELWLPVARPAIEANADDEQISRFDMTTARPALKVLAVDDDPLVLTNTAAMLEDLGHTCLRAASAAQALEILRRGAGVDLVITDQVMPRMTGVQLAQAIGRDWPKLPVMIATGYAEMEPGSGAGLPRLSKPFTQAELAAKLAQIRFGATGQVIRLRGNGRE